MAYRDPTAWLAMWTRTRKCRRKRLDRLRRCAECQMLARASVKHRHPAEPAVEPSYKSSTTSSLLLLPLRRAGGREIFLRSPPDATVATARFCYNFIL